MRILEDMNAPKTYIKNLLQLVYYFCGLSLKSNSIIIFHSEIHLWRIDASMHDVYKGSWKEAVYLLILSVASRWILTQETFAIKRNTVIFPVLSSVDTVQLEGSRRWLWINQGAVQY